MHMRSSFHNGSISNAIGNLTSLHVLDLSFNELSQEILNGISKLCKLKNLKLMANNFQGEISNVFENVSNCFGDLEVLDLRENQFSGNLTDQIGELKNLVILYLGKNSFSGPIPSNLGKLTLLTGLGLGANKFTGNLPESFGQLSNLSSLHVENNLLEGIVTESHFANMTHLASFSASANHLTLKVDSKWIPAFKPYTFRLGSWNLGAYGQIPTWIQMQEDQLVDLDLSDAGLSGNVPSWFWKISFLNISHNQFDGNITEITGTEFGVGLIYLSSNRFSGLLPRVGNNVRELDLSNNSFSGGISHFLCGKSNEINKVEILHLGTNKLSGKIPDCLKSWHSLKFLNLENNNLFGTIPDSIGHLKNLLSLNLNNNKLFGRIPYSLKRCTSLGKIDLANNKFMESIPPWMGTSLTNLRILILRSNNFSGNISPNICHLNFLQILDLSDNILSGVVPTCVDNFTAITTKRELIQYRYSNVKVDYAWSFYFGDFIESASISTKGSEYSYDTILSLVTNIDLSRNNLSGEIPKQITSLLVLGSLNLSRNHLTGLIPDGIGKMQRLESLDFSRNSLSGVIPNSLASISTLNYLDFSYNNLTGRIPESTQLMSLPASSFIGNNLCGPPLTQKCSNDGSPNAPEEKENEKQGILEVKWFYVFMSFGYAVGISAVFTTLIFKKSWRDAYFGFMEELWNKFYVYRKTRSRNC